MDIMEIVTDSDKLRDDQLISLCEEFYARAKKEYLHGDMIVAVDYLNMANVFANQCGYFHPCASFEELFED